MTVAIGAWLAAAVGGFTGAISVRLRSADGSMLLGVLVGGVLAALAYGGFLVVGFVVGLLTWSTAPAPGPALLGVVIGCAALLVMQAIVSAIVPRFGMPEVHRRSDDLIEARARGGAPTMWLAGIALALLPLTHGIRCVVTQQTEIGTQFWKSEVEGFGAIGVGLAWIGVALFLHFHFFFGLHSRLEAYSPRGKSVALVVACAGLTMAGLWAIVAVGS
jgi:hypothetical protein